MFPRLATDVVLFGRQHRQQVLALAPMELFALRLPLTLTPAVEVQDLSLRKCRCGVGLGCGPTYWAPGCGLVSWFRSCLKTLMAVLVGHAWSLASFGIGWRHPVDVETPWLYLTPLHHEASGLHFAIPWFLRSYSEWRG
jgi:hypothetical protein